MKRLLVILCVLPILPPAKAAGSDRAAECARIGNDDTVRPYDPGLRSELLKAYARLFPQARLPPDPRVFQAEAHFRCMDGHLLACFTGANLPCGRMNAARDNQGAAAFCQANPTAQIVPAFATGHDAAYAYRCVGGRPQVTGETVPLDPRGFAATFWAPLD